MCQTNYLSLALWALENVPRLSIVSIFKRQTMRTILYTIFSFPVDFINKPKFQPRPIRLSMIWKLKSNKFITSLRVHQFAKWKKYLFIKKCTYTFYRFTIQFGYSSAKCYTSINLYFFRRNIFFEVALHDKWAIFKSVIATWNGSWDSSLDLWNSARSERNRTDNRRD